MIKNKKILFLVFVTLVTFILVEDVSASWWNSSFDKRKQITFTQWTGSGTENLTDFPVLILLNSSNIDYSLINNDGSDLRFIDNDDSTILNHEIEVYSESGNSLIWVKIPLLENSSTDYIYIYHNNSTATSIENPKGVWNSNYKGVWHMKDHPCQAATCYSNDSTEVNNGTVKGVSLDFDGTSDDVNFGDIADFESSADFSVTVWFKTTSAHSTPTGMLVSKSDNGGATGRYHIGVRSSKFRASLDHGASTNLDSTVAVDDGKWHFGVVTYDVGSTLKVYVDGVENGSASIGSGATTTKNFKFGDDTDGGNEFTGTIGEVRFYNKVLTQSEIDDLYSGKHVTTNLASYWPIHTGSGLTVFDEAGTGTDRDGTITGATWDTTDTYQFNGVDQGNIDGGDVFNGWDTYTDIASSLGTIKTVSFWMYGDDVTTRKLINIDGTDQIELSSGSVVTATSFPSPTIYVNGSVASSVTANTWHYVAVTDSTGVSASNFEIGKVGTSNEFDGRFDEVRVSTDAKTAAWINASYLTQNNPYSFATFSSDQPMFGVTITLPTGTDSAYFNFTAADVTNLAPISQTDSIPIYTFLNTGNINEKWELILNQSIPSVFTICGDTDNTASGCKSVNSTAGWMVNSSIPGGAEEEVWLWGNCTTCSPSDTTILSQNHSVTHD